MAKVVLFAIHGTLLDSQDLPAQAWQETLRQFGKEVNVKDVHGHLRSGADHLMSVFLPPKQVESQSREIERYQESLFWDKYAYRARPFPQVRELFERLDLDGYRIVFASSVSSKDLHRCKRITKVGKLLDDATTIDDQTTLQSDTFLAALDSLRAVGPYEMILVGDKSHEARAAGRMGLRTIGLLCGGTSEEQLRGAGCTEVYRDCSELLKQYDRSLLAEAEMY
ncbi:MAG: HAD hydrolase-like protein [Acidobacteriota bacterium]|nr:HAD hydrolase-like protein [Acidobacteriota bacterium]